MRFLVDAQLPPALVERLLAGGHEAEHVGERQMQTASDAAIWDYALATSAVIVTKDEDFAQRKVLTASATGPAVVWIRLPNTRRRDLLIWFETVMPQILAALERGETLIEVT
jgi:predicted nuclease of predicted toxin-antitoxin system